MTLSDKESIIFIINNRAGRSFDRPALLLFVSLSIAVLTVVLVALVLAVILIIVLAIVLVVLVLTVILIIVLVVHFYFTPFANIFSARAEIILFFIRRCFLYASSSGIF